MGKFIGSMKAFDYELTKRILEFSNQLNQMIIERVKPKVILVPNSIAAQPAIDDFIKIDLSMKVNDVAPIIIGNENQFKYYSFNKQYSFGVVRVISCPHPGQFPYIRKENRVLGVQQISPLLP